MANYSFVITWTRPNGTSVDITARTLLRELGELTAAFEAADELFTYTSSDLALGFDNQDGFFTDEMEPFPGKTSALADLRSRFIVDVERNGSQVFRGFVLPNKMAFDRFEKTVSVTALSPLRLCDLARAELVNRGFGILAIGAVAPVGSQEITLSAVPTAQIFEGDVLRIAGEEYFVRGISGGVVSITEGVETELGIGIPVEVVTPYYRYKTIDFLVQSLFLQAGISDLEIDYSGIISDEPFESPLNTGPANAGTKGLEGFDESRLFLARRFDSSDSNPPRLGLQMRRANLVNGESGVRQAMTPDSGFESAGLGGNLSTLPPSVSVYAGGMWGAYWDERNARGGSASQDAFWAGAESDVRKRVQTMPMDQFSSSWADSEGFLHATERRAYTIVPLGLGPSTFVFLYELKFTQTVQDTGITQESPGGEIRSNNQADWLKGGLGDYKLELRRYTTANQGRAWTLDATFNGGSGVLVIYDGAAPLVNVLYTGATFPMSLDGFARINGSGYDSFLVMSYWSVSTNPNGVLVWRTISGATPNVVTSFIASPSGQAKTLYAGGSRVECFYEDINTGSISQRWFDGNSGFNFVGNWPITQERALLRTLCWNAQAGAASRLGGLWSSPAGGSGWVVFYPGVATLPAPANLFGPEDSGVVDSGKSHVMLDASNFPAYPVGSVGIPWIRSRDLPDTNDPRQAASIPWLTRWAIINGGDAVTVFVMRVADRWLILSNRHLGYIAYANFEGLSVSQALTQIGFVVNASVDVRWLAGTLPLGRFIGRDRAPVAPVKTIQSADGSKPAGAVQNLALRVRDLRAWEHNYAFVELTGATEEIVASYGDVSRKSEALFVSSRFVEFQRLADVIAYNLWLYYAPGRKLLPAPTLSVSGTAAGVVYRYGFAPVDASGNFLAVSEVAVFVNGPATLSTGLGRVASISWPAYVGAAAYKVFRVAGGLTQGLVATVGGLLAVDGGLAANGVEQLPGEFQGPRQAVEVDVWDDGTVYAPRDEVRVADIYGRVDPASPFEAPLWWIQSVGSKPTDPSVRLLVVQKAVTD